MRKAVRQNQASETEQKIHAQEEDEVAFFCSKRQLVQESGKKGDKRTGSGQDK